MMSVLSIRPMTISTVWATRRGMLRSPILNMMRFRSATYPMEATETPSAASNPTMM